MSADELAAYVTALVDAAPPLSAEQRENISALLQPPGDTTSGRAA